MLTLTWYFQHSIKIRRKKCFIHFYLSWVESLAELLWSKFVSCLLLSLLSSLTFPKVHAHLLLHNHWDNFIILNTNHYWREGFKFFQMKSNSFFKGELIKKYGKFVVFFSSKICFSRTNWPEKLKLMCKHSQIV